MNSGFFSAFEAATALFHGINGHADGGAARATENDPKEARRTKSVRIAIVDLPRSVRVSSRAHVISRFGNMRRRINACKRREPELIGARWGLIPSRWKDKKPPQSTFNARSEEAAAKPMWRQPYPQRAVSATGGRLVRVEKLPRRWIKQRDRFAASGSRTSFSRPIAI